MSGLVEVKVGMEMGREVGVEAGVVGRDGRVGNE